MNLSVWGDGFIKGIEAESRPKQAQLCDQKAREIEAVSRSNFILLGVVALYVEEKELWRELCDDNGNSYRSFDGWIMSSCPLSRSHVYDAKAQLRILRDNNIPIEQIAEVPRCNLRQLTKLSSAVMRDPEVQQKAATLSEAQFNQEIRQRFPEQHIEERLPMRLYPTASQRQVIDAAIAKVCELMGPMSREDALEALCADFMEENRYCPQCNMPFCDGHMSDTERAAIDGESTGQVVDNGVGPQELTSMEAQ